MSRNAICLYLAKTMRALHGTAATGTSKAGMNLLAFLMMATVSAQTWAAPIQWSPGAGGNGHYYDVVPGPGTTFQRITWNDAKTAAESSSFLGVNGYLATITSSAESGFVSTLLTDPGSGFAWVGGFQPPASPEPDGNWQWATGETWSFTNWDAGEPSNFYQADVGGPPAGSPEDALHTRPGGKWNDLPHDAFLPGYLVEYPVPEPSSIIAVTAIGIWKLGGRGYRGRKRNQN
jgi:hypothetical protein